MGYVFVLGCRKIERYALALVSLSSYVYVIIRLRRPLPVVVLSIFGGQEYFVAYSKDFSPFVCF